MPPCERQLELRQPLSSLEEQTVLRSTLRLTSRPSSKLPHLHQVATSPLAAPTPTQIMALIEKHPVTGGIGTYLQTRRQDAFKYIDPGSGDLRCHGGPALMRHDGLQAYSGAAALDLPHHRRQRQKGIEFPELGVGYWLPSGSRFEHLTQQGP